MKKHKLKSKFDLAMQKELSALSTRELKKQIRENNDLILKYIDLPESLHLYAYKCGCHIDWIADTKKLSKELVAHIILNQEYSHISPELFEVFINTATKKQLIRAMLIEYFAIDFLEKQSEEIQVAVITSNPILYRYSSKTSAITNALLRNAAAKCKLSVSIDYHPHGGGMACSTVSNPPEELVQAIMMQNIIEK